MSNTKPPVLSSAEIARSIPQAATIATTAAKPTALTGRLPYNELCLKIRLVTETDRANAITKKLAARRAGERRSEAAAREFSHGACGGRSSS